MQPARGGEGNPLDSADRETGLPQQLADELPQRDDDLEDRQVALQGCLAKLKAADRGNVPGTTKITTIGPESYPGHYVVPLPTDLGTYIAPKLYVSYGISLFENENVLSARYDLKKGFGVKVTSGQRETGLDVSYTIDR